MIFRKQRKQFIYSYKHNIKQRKLKLSFFNNYIKFFNLNYSSFISFFSKFQFKLNRKILIELNYSEISSLNSIFYLIKKNINVN